MNLKKISFVILLGVILSVFLANDSIAQTIEPYRPPDAFATSAGPSPTATPTTQSCNGNCNCICTDSRCNNMPWTYFTSDPSVTVTQCQQNCVTAANQYCSTMYPGTSTSPTPYPTPNQACYTMCPPYPSPTP